MRGVQVYQPPRHFGSDQLTPLRFKCVEAHGELRIGRLPVESATLFWLQRGRGFIREGRGSFTPKERSLIADRPRVPYRVASSPVRDRQGCGRVFSSRRRGGRSRRGSIRRQRER